VQEKTHGYSSKVAISPALEANLPKSKAQE